MPLAVELVGADGMLLHVLSRNGDGSIDGLLH
jgi:hypothetical protein